MENEKVLEVDNLHVSFQTYAGEVKAVRAEVQKRNSVFRSVMRIRDRCLHNGR